MSELPEKNSASSRAWIGIDDSPASRSECVAVSSTGKAAALNAGSPEIAARRRAGGRCAAAVPAGQVFCVRLDIPSAARKGPAATSAIESLLDAKLAFPVEDCAYSVDFAGARAGGERSAATAYAVRKADLATRIGALRSSGTDPEFLVAEPQALWRRFAASHQTAGASACVVIRVGGDRWTVIAGGNGIPAASMSCSPRDGATARRAVSALFPGVPAADIRWFLCGPEEELASDWKAFRESAGLPEDLEPEIPESPATFLAGAIAMLAAARRAEANLRPADDPPPAVERGKKRRAVFWRSIACAICALVIAADAFAVFSARRAASDAESALRSAASRLAGRPLSQRGPALVAAARQELDERLNPEIEAWTARSDLAPLSEALRVAALRDAAIHSVRLEGGKLTLSGTAGTGADIDAIALALNNLGLAVRFERVARGNAIAFSGTAMEVPE